MTRLVTLTVLLIGTVVSLPLVAQEPATQEFSTLADRYHNAFEARPRKGTLLDLMHRHYLDAGRLEELVRRYRTLAEQKPDDAAAQLATGLILNRAGDIDASRERLQRAAKLETSDYYAQYALALQLERTGKHEAAIASLREAARRSPPRRHRVNIGKRLGSLLLEVGREEEAAAAWSALLTQFPDDPSLSERVASLFLEADMRERAINEYKRLAGNPDAAPSQRLLARVAIGEIQVRQGKTQRALTTFEECLDNVRPDSWLAADIHNRIESVFVRADDLPGLISHYERRLKDRPDDVASVQHLATALERQGRYKDAIARLRSAIQVAPGRSGLWKQLVELLTRREKYRDALESTQQWLSATGESEEVLGRLGQLHLQVKTSDGNSSEKSALQAWRRIADADPEDPQAALQVARLCRAAAGVRPHATEDAASGIRERANGSRTLEKAAVNFYRLAIQRSPKSVQYREYLGEYLHAIGRHDEALDAWEPIGQAPLASADNLRRLAELYARAGATENAINASERAVKLDPERFDLRSSHADLLLESHRYPDALDAASEMLKKAESDLQQQQSLAKRVEVLAASDRVSEKLQALEQRLAKNHGTVTEHWFAAMLAADQQQFGDAIRLIQSALVEQPHHYRLRGFKAELLQRAGDLERAATEYQELARLQPRLRAVHLTSATMLEISRRNFDEALRLAELVMRESGQSSDAAELLAAVHMSRGDTQAAIEVITAAVSREPRNVELRLQLAEKLSHIGKNQEAIEHHWRVFEVQKDIDDKLQCVSRLTELYVQLDQVDELLNRLQRSARGQLNERQLSLALVQVYRSRDEYGKARRELSTVLTKNPDDIEALSLLVGLHEQIGDLDRAVQHQEQIYEITAGAQAGLRLAQLYEQSGKLEAASDLELRLASQSQNPSLLASVVEGFFDRGHFEAAAQLAEQQWHRRLTGIERWESGTRLARARFFQGEVDKAAEISREILRMTSATDVQRATSLQGRTISASPSPRSTAVLKAFPTSVHPRVVESYLEPAPVGTPTRRAMPRRWSPGNLAEAKLLAIMLLKKVAQKQGEERAFTNNLRQRAESSIAAMRQYAWLNQANASAADDVREVLATWIKRAPQDPEPRLMLFRLSWSAATIRGEHDAGRQMDELHLQYRWFEDHRPDLEAVLLPTFVGLLQTAGNVDVAKRLILQEINTAEDLAELNQLNGSIGSSLRRLGNEAVFTAILRQYERLSAKRPTSVNIATVPLSYAARTHLRFLKDQRKTNVLLEVIPRYLKLMLAGAQPSLNGLSPISATRISISTNRNHFPAHPWLDSSSQRLLQQLQSAVPSKKEQDRLLRTMRELSSRADGSLRERWDVAKIMVLWGAARHAEAIEQMEDFVDSYPARPEARVLLAKLHATVGNERGALDILETVDVAQANWQKPLAQLQLRFAHRGGVSEVARETAIRLSKMSLSTSEQLEVATILFEHGLKNNAGRLIEDAIEATSNAGENYLLLQQNLLTQAQKIHVAERLLTQTTRSTNGNSSSDRYRDRALETLKAAGRLGPRIAKLEEQLSASPNSIKLIRNLLELYRADDNTEAAQQVMTRLLQTRPNDPQLHLRHAKALQETGDTEGSLEVLETVWKQAPQLMWSGTGATLTRSYGNAKRIDLLKKHLRLIPPAKQRVLDGRYVYNMLTNLSRTASKGEIRDLYRTVLDLQVTRGRESIVAGYARHMLNENRHAEAFELLIHELIPNSHQYTVSAAAYHSSADVNVSSLLLMLADVAHELGQHERLQRELEQAASASNIWKLDRRLLHAMIARRQGDESPFTSLSSDIVASRVSLPASALRMSLIKDELVHCESTAILESALSLIRPTSVNGRGSSTTLSDARRAATIYLKLGRRAEARKVLMDSLPAGERAASSRNRQDFQIGQLVANELKRHDFLISAIEAYGHAFDSVSKASATSTGSWQMSSPDSQKLESYIDEAVNKRPGETFDLLRQSIEGTSPQIHAFFTVVDPQVARQSRGFRRSGAANSAKVPKQLLIEVLKQARESGELDSIQAKVDERMTSESQREAPNADRLEHLRAISMLCQLASSRPQEAIKPLHSWLEARSATEQVDFANATWLLSLSAMEHKSTRAVGQKLAVQSAHDAVRDNHRNRRYAIVQATLNQDLSAVAELLSELADQLGDPALRLQIADAHHKLGNHELAVKALEPVWRDDPQTLLRQLSHYADYYLKAGDLRPLIRGMRRATAATNLRTSSSSLYSFWREFPEDDKLRSQAGDFYVAYHQRLRRTGTLRFHDYRFASFLESLPRDKNTLDVYLRVLLPDDGYAPPAANLFDEFASLVQSTQSHEKVNAAIKKARKEYPRWDATGQLIEALLSARQGDEAELIALAKQYRASSNFASELSSESDLLRYALADCNNRNAMLIALELWKETAAKQQQTGYVHAAANVADLLVKLGKPEPARDFLIKRLQASQKLPSGTDGEQRYRLQLQEKQQLADAFAAHGFGEAMLAYQEALALDRPALSSTSYVNTLISNAEEAYRKFASKISDEELDRLVDHLRKSLSGRDEAAPLEQLFLSLDHEDSDASGNYPGSVMQMLIQRAKESGKLQELIRLAEEGASPEDSHYKSAFLVLAGLSINDTASAQSAMQELSATAKNDAATIDDALWQAAREALTHEATEEQARQLVRLVADEAQQRGDSARRAAAVAAMLSSSGGEAVDDLLGKSLSKESPEAAYELAKKMFTAGQEQPAFDALKISWRKKPELVLSRISEISKQYVEAGRAEDLADLLKQVSDKRLRSRYAYEVRSVARTLAQESRGDGAVDEIYGAAIDFSTEGNRASARRNYADYLLEVGRNKDGWKMMLQAVLPPDSSSESLASSAYRLADIAIELEKVDELEERVRATIKSHPQWEPFGHLLVRMVRSRRDDSVDPLLEVAKRFRADDQYADALRRSASVVQTEMSRFDNKETLEVALELSSLRLQPYRSGARRSSMAYRYFSDHGVLLSRLGRRSEALGVLKQALQYQTASVSRNYRAYSNFYRREQMVYAFRKAEYPLEALRLLQQNTALIGSEMAKQRNLDDRIKRQQQRYLPLLILEAVSTRRDEGLQQLIDELKQPDPDVRHFFSVSDRPWNRLQWQRIPEKLRGPVPEQTQLLGVLLRQAHQSGELLRLKKLAAEAGNRQPDDPWLSALAGITNNWQTDEATAEETLFALLDSPESDLRKTVLYTWSGHASDAVVEKLIGSRLDKTAQLAVIPLMRHNGSEAALEWLANKYATGEGMLKARTGQALVDLQSEHSKRWLRYDRIAHDGFDSEPTLDWKIDHPNLKHVSRSKAPGSITVRAEQGGIANHDYSNIHLWTNPLKSRDYEVTICLKDFVPKAAYQQGALLLWDDADNFLKVSLEPNRNGQTRVAAISELQNRLTNRWYFAVDTPEDRFWLRVRRFGNRYTFGSSVDGTEFSWHHTVVWKNSQPTYFGFAALAAGSPPPPEIDVAFDDFEVRACTGEALAPPAPTDPLPTAAKTPK